MQVRRCSAHTAELNPMENVREYLRGNKLSALGRKDYDAIIGVCPPPGTSSSTIQNI